MIVKYQIVGRMISMNRYNLGIELAHLKLRAMLRSSKERHTQLPPLIKIIIISITVIKIIIIVNIIIVSIVLIMEDIGKSVTSLCKSRECQNNFLLY